MIDAITNKKILNNLIEKIACYYLPNITFIFICIDYESYIQCNIDMIYLYQALVCQILSIYIFIRHVFLK